MWKRIRRLFNCIETEYWVQNIYNSTAFRIHLFWNDSMHKFDLNKSRMTWKVKDLVSKCRHAKSWGQQPRNAREREDVRNYNLDVYEIELNTLRRKSGKEYIHSWTRKVKDLVSKCRHAKSWGQQPRNAREREDVRNYNLDVYEIELNTLRRKSGKEYIHSWTRNTDNTRLNT